MAYLNAGTFLRVVIFNLILIGVSCERVREKMYKSINGAFCFKRLNATHEFGCTSSRSGNTGVLHIINLKSDLDWLLQKANAAPYVVMLRFDFPDFTETLLELKNSGKVSGVILTSNRTSFSPDDTCPNRYSGLSDYQFDSKPWNRVGSSLLFVNFGFPIMYIDSEEYPNDLEVLNECFQKYNAHDLEFQASRSLCAVELTSHMLAAVDSRTCIRRSSMVNNLAPMRLCDPLLGLNIHLPLFPRIRNKEPTPKKKSTILVVTRLDGTSMFDGLVPGAGSPVIGVVSLLTIAHVLYKMSKDKPPQDKNVVFVFFHGESYDYIGSSRMIYDMENDAFPYRLQDVAVQSDLLKLQDIELIVELDEVTKSEIFYHSLERPTDSSELVFKFIKTLNDQMRNLSLKLSDSIGRLPPASLQRFLRKERNMKGVVLSSYNSSYDNQYYHSIFDTGRSLNFKYYNKTQPPSDSIQKYVASFSLAIARALYQVVFDAEEKEWKSITEVITLVDELMYCYMESPSCEMFEKVTFVRPLEKKPYPVYVGVIRNNNITTLTGLTLAWLTGTEVQKNRSNCHNGDKDLIYQYIWMVGDSEDGVCIQTLMNYSLAQSPAFEIKDYNWTSNEYSTWTESVWQEKMSARVFIKPSRQHEILTLSIGILAFILSFIIVYFISTKANILFNQQILESARC